MKFAKELESDLVPEWRVKYLDYKLGKKKIKAITRAIRNAQKSPGATLRSRPNARRSQSNLTRTPVRSNGHLPRSLSANFAISDSEEDDEHPLRNPKIRQSIERVAERTPAIPIRPGQEREPIKSANGSNHALRKDGTVFTRYGSIIGSPPSPSLSRPATLNLPEPAMDPESPQNSSLTDRPQPASRLRLSRLRPGRNTIPGASRNAFEVGKTKHPFPRHISFSTRHTNLLGQPQRLSESERPLLKRIFSPLHGSSQSAQPADMPLEAMQEIDEKQDEFFSFLDDELDKVESFYKSKEEEANERLQILREQLHVMRDQRLEEIIASQKRRELHKRHGNGLLQGADEINVSMDDLLSHPSHISDVPHGLDVIYHPIKAAKQVHFRKPPKENHLVTPPTEGMDHNKDYVLRRGPREIPYLTAKRKLKTALQEFYRGLELLKSYALLNRTAFRKMNKKYDKAIRARPTMRYMTEKVNDAYFVRSTVLEGHITSVEDLYARYFEKGSHKIAVGKLRRKNRQAGSYTGSVFRNGFLAATGLVFGIEGLVYAYNLLDNSSLSNHTSYLLQIYAGYFLLLFLFLFFCFDCMIFTESKVNYVFVFEFDTRHNLDWRQLCEIPCFCLFILGLTLWLNFSRIGGDEMFLWYPVILLGVTGALLFFPLQTLYHESRKWFLYSCFRLAFGSGLYPVEFRDFFLGDMFCSQTYALGGIELFFCLYTNEWTNPARCGSTSSRLLGFFTTLPGIWRALQCIRRYRDTKNIFPHLVNCGKYMFTILAAMSLSMYRIDKSYELRAFFITCSLINSIYCSIWDLLMDWSLLDPVAPHPFLRQHLAYKQVWWYYIAMVLDPILRFNWIFYAVFKHELQHSAILSFIVGFTEICRRGIWTIFRVENEHCTNVERFRASRDVPLPYKKHNEGEDDEQDSEADERDHERAKDKDAIAAAGELNPENGWASEPASDAPPAANSGAAAVVGGFVGSPHGTATGADLERHPSAAVNSLRRRQTVTATPAYQSIRQRFGNILRRAHAQDFERRRKSIDETKPEESDEEEEEEESDDDDPAAAPDERRRQEGVVEGSSETVGDAASPRSQGAIGSDDGDRRDREDITVAEILLHRARGEPGG